MTYPEDVLKAAEGVTHWWLSTEGATYQDLTAKVAEKLMAERQRCAGVASRMEVGGIVETPEFITAILGQQEPSA